MAAVLTVSAGWVDGELAHGLTPQLVSDAAQPKTTARSEIALASCS